MWLNIAVGYFRDELLFHLHRAGTDEQSMLLGTASCPMFVRVGTEN